MATVWILIGTFLATREALAQSNGRTLVTLASAGAGVIIVATILRLAVAAISLGWSHDNAGCALRPIRIRRCVRL